MPAGDLITANFQIEWRNILWGAGQTTQITDLRGWLDAPPLRGTNAERPGRHGTWPGTKHANERTIEVELTVMEDDATALTALRAATAYAEDPVEEDLVIWAGTDEPQLVRARLERRAVPTDHEWSVGHHRAVMQWTASDPKRYAVAETVSATIGLPTAPAGGLAFPLAFPLDFGASTGPQQLTLTSTGDVATWPTFTVVGPVTGPIITNTTTGQQLLFRSGFAIGAGQTMTVDTDIRAVTIAGVSRRDELVVAEWFSLPADVPTTIQFSGAGAYDPAAGMTARYRMAWL